MRMQSSTIEYEKRRRIANEVVNARKNDEIIGIILVSMRKYGRGSSPTIRAIS
jgi:hypothetical protein